MPSRRVLAAICVPVALTAAAGALALAAPANAADDSTPLPFPTTICSTATASRTQEPTASAAPKPTPSEYCVPPDEVGPNTADSPGLVAAEDPWHLGASSMTMYNLTYLGTTTVRTAGGSQQVLEFTAAKVTLVSMVTYSKQKDGKRQYVNGGKNRTVTLTNVHLWSKSMTADVLGLVHQTFTPDSPGLLTALRGVTIPIPLLFTDVEADNAFLSVKTIVIPGFSGHGN